MPRDTSPCVTLKLNELGRRSPVGRAPAHERGARIKIPTMMPDALRQFKATQPVVASPAGNGCLEVLQYRWAVPPRKLNQSSRSSSGLQTSIQSAPALTAWMVAQARKLQDAVQRRLPDVRIVLQEGRTWQTDGLLEVCEHRGAIQATDLSAPPHGLCNEHEPRLAAPRIHEREEGATRRPIRPRPISISAFPEICCWQTRNHTPPSPGRR